jgi:glycosyltransferase involved in cell wall biosynthesis
VKGAVALANALVATRDVTVVALKRGGTADELLVAGIRTVSLDSHGWAGRVRAYRDLLAAAGGRGRAASVSCCLSADLVNGWCRSRAVICASVRGNLIVNYRLDYGPIGVPVATGHLGFLRRFDHLVAMTQAMAEQVRVYAGRVPHVIGNFIDEAPLERYRRAHAERDGPLRFVFLASLSERKQPFVVIDAVHELRRCGADARLDIIGDGPLRAQVAEQIARLDLDAAVVLHGYQDNPYEIVAQADVMVLPSLAEGVPRAALEALYLGVPCVLRDVDGNAELIDSGSNGMLFRSNAELSDAMTQTAGWSRARRGAMVSLLPGRFRQATAVSKYQALVESC